MNMDVRAQELDETEAANAAAEKKHDGHAKVSWMTLPAFTRRGVFPPLDSLALLQPGHQSLAHPWISLPSFPHVLSASVLPCDLSLTE